MGRADKTVIDRGWPHQVAVEERFCTGHNYYKLRFFCGARQNSKEICEHTPASGVIAIKIEERAFPLPDAVLKASR